MEVTSLKTFEPCADCKNASAARTAVGQYGTRLARRILNDSPNTPLPASVERQLAESQVALARELISHLLDTKFISCVPRDAEGVSYAQEAGTTSAACPIVEELQGRAAAHFVTIPPPTT